MCPCRSLLFPVVSILIGSLLLAANYGYSAAYYVQAWWPILFVISGAAKLVKQCCCNNKNKSCNSEVNGDKCGK